ncbi:hypothetical protein DPMN_059820 [Dreissena polymorpha]|uniref:Uncharacterized protein n=1 Tax=Dreissena polymorpha TaxID=45954 RepID=A0A9D4C4G1_DREPO|nr:hypothetical protein DPMN_059820 [Dreissena polymorpha]
MLFVRHPLDIKETHVIRVVLVIIQACDVSASLVSREVLVSREAFVSREALVLIEAFGMIVALITSEALFIRLPLVKYHERKRTS